MGKRSEKVFLLRRYTKGSAHEQMLSIISHQENVKKKKKRKKVTKDAVKQPITRRNFPLGRFTEGTQMLGSVLTYLLFAALDNPFASSAC